MAGFSHLLEFHESKLPFVLRIEFIRTKHLNFSCSCIRVDYGGSSSRSRRLIGREGSRRRRLSTRRQVSTRRGEGRDGADLEREGEGRQQIWRAAQGVHGLKQPTHLLKRKSADRKGKAARRRESATRVQGRILTVNVRTSAS